MRAQGVKTFRLPRRTSFAGGLQRLKRERPEIADVYLQDATPDPVVKYLKHLPDDACEALNRMLDEHGTRSIVGALVQLLGERCHDNPFDLDNMFEHSEESERHSHNAKSLIPVIETLK